MSIPRLTGNGAPTRMTVGVVGQHYEDLDTGNIYECLVASETSRLHGDIGGGYVWKRHVTGEDRLDHEAIFGGGGVSCVALTAFEGSSNLVPVGMTFDEALAILKEGRPLLATMPELSSTSDYKYYSTFLCKSVTAREAIRTGFTYIEVVSPTDIYWYWTADNTVSTTFPKE